MEFFMYKSTPHHVFWTQDGFEGKAYKLKCLNELRAEPDIENKKTEVFFHTACEVKNLFASFEHYRSAT